jgi:aminopeptidase N
MIALTVLLLAQRSSPWAPPIASLHYAPDRTCDLQHVAVTIDVDYPKREFTGHVVNTMSPLRDGIRVVRLMAGQILRLDKVTVDGAVATYRRDGKDLFIDTPPLHKGKPISIAIDYVATNSQGRSFGGGGGGWHWVTHGTNGPDTRVGFWTQGETDGNSDWVPIWDYPNDLTTSETWCTVPADWSVIGNGVLADNRTADDGKRRTFHWVMKQPHATFLLSLCGGPFDIKRDNWEGVQLWYVVPKGEGKYIDDTFGDTKDMLSFYSSILGVKYAWPKYAQDAMYDFGGGMENVSATTLGTGEITEARAGFRNAASINSHELGHQWFGDLVTCKDWGDIYLNESFATYMQMMYFDHSRGRNAYDREVDNNIRGYLGGARRFKHPLSTKMYANADQMFDSSHTYDKGGVILHTLRRYLGDDNFFAGLHLYLTTWRHTPVQSSQLCRAMTEATGVNCEPFWAQWIDKPGHPVLDYTWTPSGSAISLTVRQTQDTSDGTPIFDIPGKVGVIVDGKMTQMPLRITKAEETFTLPVSGSVQAVVLDPDHDYLREIPTLHWAASELPAILAAAPNGDDRWEAMNRLLSGTPSDATIRLVADAVRNDRAQFPSLRTIQSVVSLERPEFRPVFLSLLDTPSIERRTEAVRGLARLPVDDETTKRLRALINAQEAIPVVVAAIDALAKWDAKANADVFRKALDIPSRGDRIKRSAQSALGG